MANGAKPCVSVQVLFPSFHNSPLTPLATGFKDVITFGKYGHEDWGTQAFVARDELFNPLNRLMIGDTLTICCEVSSPSLRCFTLTHTLPSLSVQVTALSHVTYVSRPQNSLYAPLDNWQLTLQNDFSPLLLNKQYSDLNFVVYSSATAGEPTNGSAIQQDMKVIPVHRAIISMRFPFFNRLLNAHDPVKQIHIVDTDCEVFEALLFFVYSGQAPLEERLHLPLLALANKVRRASVSSFSHNQLSASFLHSTNWSH